MAYEVGDGAYIVVLGGFEIVHGGRSIPLPLGAQRLLALLALHDRGMHRSAAAERLWPDCSPRRAAANLRSALWKGRQVGTATLIDCAGPQLRLSPTARVDLRELQCRMRTALDAHGAADGDLQAIADGLSRELLPGWVEDWLILERDQWDQVRLHALEGFAKQLLTAGRYLPALQTALTAVAIEPIRETAHRIVIEIHAAEGNTSSALKHYQRYRGLLHRELGVCPSQKMTQLVRPMMTS